MVITIEKNNRSEIIVKKSKFIANIFHVENEEEANIKIKEIKKEFYDAKHNCYALRINDNGRIIEKYSDDGEPAGTAGQPILNVLRGKNLENVLLVVTRYFGGILLGTGGLVKAYTDSTIKVVDDTDIIKQEKGKKIKLEINYSDLENLNYYMRQNRIKIYDTRFLQNVEVFLEIDDENIKKIDKNLDELKFKIIKKEIIEEDCYITIVE